MEAMAAGLPVIASKIRGCEDLVDADSGCLFDPHSIEDCKKSLEEIILKDFEYINSNNMLKIPQFSTNNVNKEMKSIYLC